MANNYSEMSIAFEVTEEQGRWLEEAWETMRRLDETDPPGPPLGLSVEDIDYPPCAFEIKYESDAYPRAWMYSEENVDAEILANVLQQFLKHFELDYGIGIEAAMTCSKPKIGEFGGFAAWVTKDDAEWMSTGQWLFEKKQAHVAKKGELLPVTCDNCNARSESGWGDTPLCIRCQLIVDPTLVCEEHERTHDGICPLEHGCPDCGERPCHPECVSGGGLDV